MTKSAYNTTQAVDISSIISSPDSFDLSFMGTLLLQFMEELVQILQDDLILQSQAYSTRIIHFNITYIIVLIILTVGGWRLFVKSMSSQLDYVKKIFRILPNRLIISNNYLRLYFKNELQLSDMTSTLD